MSLGLQNCLGKKLRGLKQTNKWSFLFFPLGPFGERDDQQVFIQKVVPITNKLFVRLSSTGKRYIHVLSGNEAGLGLFRWCFLPAPCWVCAGAYKSSTMLDSSGWTPCVPVTDLPLNDYYNFKDFLRSLISEIHFMMELTKQTFLCLYRICDSQPWYHANIWFQN